MSTEEADGPGGEDASTEAGDKSKEAKAKPPKFTDPRPMIGLGPRMIALVTGSLVGIDASADMLAVADLPAADLRVARLEDELPAGPCVEVLQPRPPVPGRVHPDHLLECVQGHVAGPVPDPAVHNGFPALGAGRVAGDFRLVWQDTRGGGTNSWNTWFRETANGGATPESSRKDGLPARESLRVTAFRGVNYSA